MNVRLLCIIALIGRIGLEPAWAAQESVSSELIPDAYQAVTKLDDYGNFLSRDGIIELRVDDGNHYHGYDGPLVWAQESMAVNGQGLVYGVENNYIVSAGYLISQDDLAAGRSFHGLTLREIDLPAAYSMTIEFVEGVNGEANAYLFLWHFVPPQNSNSSMMSYGELPEASRLSDEYQVFACDHVPATRFCPGMGRHFIDLSDSTVSPAFTRQPDSQGELGVIYGEAAQKLIFIEYVFAQQDFINGVNWSVKIPLDGLSIPPIDNVHVLHFGTDTATDGRYTVHMYFLPEAVYLPWEAEPDSL